MKTLLISVLCLVAPALACADEPAAKDFKLEQLLQRRAQVKEGRASFVETRVQPTFELTTTVSGVLVYQAPDRLERQNLKPSTDRAVIQGDTMSVDIGLAGGPRMHRDIKLADVPALRTFFTALRGFLSGNQAALEQHFLPTFSGTENDWRLKLVPKAPADRHVREIIMSGRVADLLVTEVFEKNGDSTRTTLTPDPANATVSPTARDGS